MALLDTDNQLIKSLDFEYDLGDAEKLEFIDAQIVGIKAQMWRSRVDAILNRNIATSDDKERAAVQGKIAEHEADVKRFAEAVTILEKLRDELK